MAFTVLEYLPPVGFSKNVEYLLRIRIIFTIKPFVNREQIKALNCKGTALDWYYSRYNQKLKFLTRDLLFMFFVNLTPGIFAYSLIWNNGVFLKWIRNSVNSAISGNLMNHWSMNWAQFKDTFISATCVLLVLW